MRQSLGWDWSAGEARWVELVEDHGRPKVRNFGTAALPAAENGAAVEPLRALVAQRRWRGREVVTAVPRTAVTLTWLAMPAAARDDLAGMVEMEAAQTLPFSVEEAAWDFAAAPAANGGQSVLLVAARRQLVEERRRQVEGVGLRLGALSVDVLATAALARAAAPDSGHAGVLVLLGAESATLSYVEDGRVLMSRTAALAPASASPQWDAAALALEVRRTMVAGSAASGGGAAGLEETRVWLTGDRADAGLAEALSTALPGSGGATTRVALLPRDAIEGAEALPRSLDLALGLALLGLHVPGGAAFDAVDLARRARVVVDATQAQPHRRLGFLVGAGGVALVVALLLLAGPGPNDLVLARAASRAQAEAKQLATRRTEMEGRVRDLMGAIVPPHSYLDVLNDVSARAGAQIWLTQFTYDKGHPVVIRGAARTNTAVARLVDGLRSSPHLESVALGAMTETATGKIPVVQFIIQATVRGDTLLETPRRRSGKSAPTKKEPV